MVKPILLTALTLLTAPAALAKDQPVTDQQIQEARERTQACMREFGVAPYKVSKARPQGQAYRRWVLRLWQERANTCRLLLIETRNPTVAITLVFGKYADQALAVASCESGRGVWAQNGQYLGMFQMGDYARSRYGHGDTPLEQARAAYRYFADTGYSWGPWQCKPWN